MFVFAHLMAPHLPHAYDVNGNVLLEFPRPASQAGGR